MIETWDLVRKGDSSRLVGTRASERCADYECKRCGAKIHVSLEVDFELRDLTAVRDHGECKR